MTSWRLQLSKRSPRSQVGWARYLCPHGLKQRGQTKNLSAHPTRLVYDIYGLTDEEINIVESE